MSRRRYRPVSVFGLSFLDVMFCGFGSVILLVMIVNAKAITHRTEVSKDLRGEVERLEREVLEGERYLTELTLAVEETGRQSADSEARAASARDALAIARADLAALAVESQARTEHVNALAADLKTLDERKSQAAARNAEREAEEKSRGEQVRRFLGDGDRQYLTGLKMGGARVLVLVDASASMLADTVVNVILRRNLSDEVRRSSPKWQRALATVEWLVSQLPPTGQYQIYSFDTETRPALGETRGRWLDTGDAQMLDRAIAALREVVPNGGTSLHRAFSGIAGLRPPPDNIFLVTDGLPTQGSTAPSGTKVSGEQRLRHFQQAIKRLPKGVPVNTVLFPMEGDPLAASAFWRLAMLTRGSFISPSKDWP